MLDDGAKSRYLTEAGTYERAKGTKLNVQHALLKAKARNEDRYHSYSLNLSAAAPSLADETGRSSCHADGKAG